MKLFVLSRSQFLSRTQVEKIADEIGHDVAKVRALGRTLTNYHTTNEIFRNCGDDPVAATLQILKKWRMLNKRLDEAGLVRQLVRSVKENDSPADASKIQARYYRDSDLPSHFTGGGRGWRGGEVVQLPKS